MVTLADLQYLCPHIPIPNHLRLSQYFLLHSFLSREALANKYLPCNTRQPSQFVDISPYRLFLNNLPAKPRLWLDVVSNHRTFSNFWRLYQQETVSKMAHRSINNHYYLKSNIATGVVNGFWPGSSFISLHSDVKSYSLTMSSPLPNRYMGI